jgi:hypothetical protein
MQLEKRLEIGKKHWLMDFLVPVDFNLLAVGTEYLIKLKGLREA